MFLHQSKNVLINSTDIIKNAAHFGTINNIKISAHSIVTISTRENGMCTMSTLCISELKIKGIMVFQDPQLVMLKIVHLKSKVESNQVLITLINLSNDTMHITRHILVRSLRLYTNF